jgi:hypothetical protein
MSRVSGYWTNSVIGAGINSDGVRLRSVVGALVNTGVSAAGGLVVSGLTAMPAAAQVSADGKGQLVLFQVLVVVFGLTTLAALVWAIRCRRRGRFLDRLFASLPGPRIAVDRNGKQVAATASWTRLFGENDAPIEALGALAARDGADG